MALRSIRARLIVFFGGLLVVLASAAIIGIHFVSGQNAERQVARELTLGQRVFARYFDDKAVQLRQAASVLVGDFGFREAVATRDVETVNSVLANHGRRIAADLIVMSDHDGRISASSSASARVGGPFPYAELLERARAEGQAAGFGIADGGLYQMIVLAVRAPAVIGWVAMGFAVDDALAGELGELTGLNVSFLVRSASPRWQVAGSNLTPAALRSALPEFAQLLDQSVDGMAAAMTSDMPGADSDRRAITRLLDGPDQAAAAVLQRSLAGAHADAARLRAVLGTMTLSGLLAALFGSFVIARGVTTPLRQLGSVARDMAGGDYTQPVVVASRDEIGALAETFNHMREAIATRESTIMDLAYRDGLTQLPNRALLHDRLQQAIAAARRDHGAVCLLLLDLDNFQLVNTTLGHSYGDRVLQAVAHRLQGLLARRSDTLARLGGDEFAILLPGADLVAARLMATRLLAVLETPIAVGSQVVDVGGSIGIVAFPEHGEDAALLMSRVDLSMAFAKRSRAGFIEYDPRYEQSPERLSLMSELRSAVENDELVLFYQPKVDLASGRVEQVEALVRWTHPVRGFVPPDAFIPFAEQTGYIRVITHWVIEAACAQLARWRRNGIALDVCINVSARDLLNNDLPRYIVECVTRHAVPVSALTLEVTESAIMDDPVRAQDNLQRLRELGLRLSIDDFGTGYSSLAYLKRLPVSELKIDKAFVLNMDKNTDDAIIVRGTIDLAHNLGLKVVAEGVEGEVAQAMLAAWGCDVAQGYHISKPLAAAALETWLTARAACVDAGPPLSPLAS